jgi:hypothetical protein
MDIHELLQRAEAMKQAYYEKRINELRTKLDALPKGKMLPDAEMQELGALLDKVVVQRDS